MVVNFVRQITIQTANSGDRDPQRRTDAGGELQRERDAADLGGEGEQVDEERGAEVREPARGPAARG